MKPRTVRIDGDDSDPSRFKVTVSYQEDDSRDTMGRSAEIVVYLKRNGRSLPDSGPEISAEAVEQAKRFLRSILAAH
jgi:hypothetical protein